MRSRSFALGTPHGRTPPPSPRPPLRCCCSTPPCRCEVWTADQLRTVTDLPALPHAVIFDVAHNPDAVLQFLRRVKQVWAAVGGSGLGPESRKGFTAPPVGMCDSRSAAEQYARGGPHGDPGPVLPHFWVLFGPGPRAQGAAGAAQRRPERLARVLLSHRVYQRGRLRGPA